MARASLTAGFPNYNHSRYLPQAIEAILGQSRQPDEFIIVDDASTDNSVEIIQSYARQHPVLRLVQNERNLGAAASLRLLQTTAVSDYLYQGAADDYVLPGFFEQAMALAERYPEAGVIMGKVVVVDANDEGLAVAGIRRWREPLYASPERFLREYLNVEYVEHSLTSATIYRWAALAEIGYFRPELGYWTDTFAIRALALKYGACYSPEPWATWRVFAESFGSQYYHNLEARLALADTISTLMRTPEFADRFPESYARTWRRDLRLKVLDDYIWRLREPLGRSAWGMLQGRLLKRLLGLQVALQYHGDVAAFIRDHQARHPKD